jgi:hypothetical protein
MNARKWNSGPPPHVGWWLTQTTAGEWWRWWGGRHWSIGCKSGSNDPGWIASVKRDGFPLAGIRWTTYWPKNARVPRIDPRKDTR